jgi:hypothetical protein
MRIKMRCEEANCGSESGYCNAEHFCTFKFDLDLQETKDILLNESLSLDPTLSVTEP